MRTERTGEQQLNLPKGENLLPPENIGRYFYVVNPEGVDVYSVDICQPRGSSTARAILNASAGDNEHHHQIYDEVHFQPWKFAQRYSQQLAERGLDPNVVINRNGTSKMILLKETPGGPNDPKENFDPVEILISKGVKADQIRALVGIREPFSQFASWKKFDDTRQEGVFLDGQEYVLGLIDKYQSQGIQVAPFVFELFYPSAEDYLKWIYYQQLDLQGQISLPNGLEFQEDPSVIWHEANPALDSLGLDADIGSRYFERVVQPILNWRRYQIPQPQIPAEVSQEQLKQAANVYLTNATDFYIYSTSTGLPRNPQFEQFLHDYEQVIG